MTDLHGRALFTYINHAYKYLLHYVGTRYVGNVKAGIVQLSWNIFLELHESEKIHNCNI